LRKTICQFRYLAHNDPNPVFGEPPDSRIIRKALSRYDGRNFAGELSYVKGWLGLTYKVISALENAAVRWSKFRWPPL
jgi:hypothetical protein